MRRLFSLSLFAFALSCLALPASAQITRAIDFGEARAQGLSAGSVWTPSPDGSSATHTGNGAPSFFVLPGYQDDVVLRGTLQVGTSEDDDYIGLVFGYRTPNAFSDRYRFKLLDWKQAEQSYGSGVAREGFRLLDVDCAYDTSRDNDTSVGAPGACDFDAFFNNEPVDGYDVLAANQGAGLGWEAFTSYDVEVRYSLDSVRVAVTGGTGVFRDGLDVIALSAADAALPEFLGGQIGLYNFSQSAASYADFTLQTLQEVEVSFAPPNPDCSYCGTIAEVTEGDTGWDGSLRLDLRISTSDGEATRSAAELQITQVGGSASSADFAPSTSTSPPVFGSAFPWTFMLPRGASGDSTITIEIPIVDDGFVEGTETATFELVSPNGARSTITVTVHDNDEGLSGALAYGTCPEPPAALPAGRHRCFLQASGTNALPYGQRYTVFLRLDGPDGVSRISFRGEIKPAANETVTQALPLRFERAHPAGAYTVTLLAEAGSVPAPSDAAQVLASLPLQKAGAALRAEQPLAVHPNPARQSARLLFSVAEAAEATLVVYDALGREVARPVEGRVSGVVEASVDVSALPAGLYVARLAVDGRTETVRFSVVR